MTMCDPTVTIVDYGLGNLLSVRRGFEHCGAAVRVTASPDAVWRADRLILPGVGAFGDGMAKLCERGLDHAVREFVGSGRPLLGICLGMQMLFEDSDEFGRHAGLGLIAGRVTRIPSTCADGASRKVPHIGWSPIEPPADTGRPWTGTLLEGTAPDTAFYFVHSFTGVPGDPADRLADTDYLGARVSAVVARDAVLGTQFHPEKSGPAGLTVIRRFLAL